MGGWRVRTGERPLQASWRELGEEHWVVPVVWPGSRKSHADSSTEGAAADVNKEMQVAASSLGKWKAGMTE